MRHHLLSFPQVYSDIEPIESLLPVMLLPVIPASIIVPSLVSIIVPAFVSDLFRPM